MSSSGSIVLEPTIVTVVRAAQAEPGEGQAKRQGPKAKDDLALGLHLARARCRPGTGRIWAWRRPQAATDTRRPCMGWLSVGCCRAR
eukprot:2756638-Alexandrium_andersonii.AAC.1